MKSPVVLQEAVFHPKVCLYWLFSGAIILTVIVITIPLLPLWFLFGMIVTRKFLEHMSCTLTDRTLVVKKGWLDRIEKTIPLEKITDLAIKQGPIMRAMGLHLLSIETAGSSGGAASGSLVSLIGIEGTIAFRNDVLAQRDSLVSQHHMSEHAAEPQRDTLVHIGETLDRIEKLLQSDRRI